MNNYKFTAVRVSEDFFGNFQKMLKSGIREINESKID
jgi:hypothetical protein